MKIRVQSRGKYRIEFSPLPKGRQRGFLILLGTVVFLAGLSAVFFLPPATAMTPEEILRKSDEARGNADGIEWEIAMTSVESG